MASSSVGTRPIKLVSEATRERETFRYDASLFTEFHFLQDGGVLPSSELTNPNDAILTGLAQLGAYQTKTDRAFISLFDASYQYIVAEAQPSMRIAQGLAGDISIVPLALRGTAIPRHQGTCDHVLYLQGNPDSDDPDALPLSFVPNLVTDQRFSSRPYCQFGDGGQFYAGVPIRTQRGINIGAFCVMSQKIPEEWDEQSTHYMRDISHAIMDHLEHRRSKSTSRLHERMNRGLGSFIEGRSTLTGWQAAPNQEAFIDDPKFEGALNARQQQIEHSQQEAIDDDELAPEGSRSRAQASEYMVSRNDMTTERQKASGNTASSNSPRHNTGPAVNPSINIKTHNSKENHDTEMNESIRVFSKAANIIREAFQVEGCSFMETKAGAYAPLTSPTTATFATLDEFSGQLYSTSSSDDQPPVQNKLPDAFCNILGFSTTDASSIDGVQLVNDKIGRVPSRFLAKLLRRYPNGKIFNFDAAGELQSSDSSDDDGESVPQPDSVATPSPTDKSIGGDTPQESPKTRKRRLFSRKREESLIQQAFPSARSVAFFTLRDSKRDRWLAGGFIYTLNPTHIFSIEGELSFLEAFGRVISAELLKLETIKTDKAKSDALGSLSHELRSPLHGIILGTELLNDTELNAVQGNTTHMIETCCRTLLDTIDHLLDYSKINSFAKSKQNSLASTVEQPGFRKRSKSSQFGKKLHTNARLDGIIEEVAQSMFAGFNFQKTSIRQYLKQRKSGFTETAAHVASDNQLDITQAMEQLSPEFSRDTRQHLGSGYVSVTLDVDPRCCWMFYMQPGAIRRVFMNLFGNSLKYTASGYIRVSLTQDAPVPRQPATERLVKLTVKDSGKGIGEDYMKHKLFKPFSQEDELASGTGLGLNLVKAIVSQLRGQIHIESQVGVGTTVIVTLPLEQSSQPPNVAHFIPEDDRAFDTQLQDLKGLRLRICGFGQTEAHDGERSIVEHICRDWLKLDLVSDERTPPDITLWSASALPTTFEETVQLAKIPNVVVCNDALSAYQQHAKYQELGSDGVLECISQPIGPRTLAKSLALAYKKWQGRPRIVSAPRPPGPSRAHSAYGNSTLLPRTMEIEVPRPLALRNRTPSELSSSTPGERKLDDRERPAECDASESSNAIKILLVDDNHINLKILGAFMAKLGRAYEMTVNGKEAVDAYIAHPEQFEAILMDISMPVMDGLEATRQIRAHERKYKLKASPILALTGLSSESIHQEASDSGVDLFLTKPARLKTISEALESMSVRITG